MRELTIFRLFASLLIADLTLAELSLVGSSQSFTYEKTNSNENAVVLWRLQNGPTNQTLLHCTQSLVLQCDAIDETVHDLYTANVTLNASTVTSVFTIKSVTTFHHGSTWFGVHYLFPHIGMQQSVKYDLNVFASAESPSCYNVTIFDKVNILISCWTHKVFPGSVCVFFIKTNAYADYELDNGSISYTHEQNATTGCYKTNCNYTVSTAFLGPGSHKFRVVMYPNITSDLTEDMKTTSNYTVHIDIDLSFAKWSLVGTSQSFTFVKTNSAENSIVTWRLQSGPTYQTLIQCTATPTLQCDALDDPVNDLYTANVTSDSSTLKSVFTIKSVAPFQHNSIWFCVHYSWPHTHIQESAKYDLNVFAPAESPSCDSVTLFDEVNILISCWTQKVFPGSVCVFFVKTNAYADYELEQGSIGYTHEQNATTGYYKTNCNYTVSASLVGPGSHMFRVVMYPNITSKVTEEMKSTSNYTVHIDIGFVFTHWSLVGSAQSFTYVKPSSAEDAVVVWQLQNGPTNQSLIQCTSTPTRRCDALEDRVNDLYTANVTSDSSKLISVFTINSVTPFQDKSTWFGVFYSWSHTHIQESLQYDLSVFVPAESPSCDNVTLFNEVNILISCWTHKVFPGSVCVFFVITNVSAGYELEQESINYTHEQNATTGYYKTNCNYTVSAAILGPGSHMFRVVMYPNITSKITEEMKKTSNYTVHIDIGYPKAALSPDCHVKDYIKENETSTCTCFDNNTSFLPTQVKWSPVDSKNGTLIFIAQRSSLNSQAYFQCVVSNTLNFTDVINYQPVVAYPPDIILTLANTEFDLCDNKRLDIFGNCFVTDSYPVSSVSIYINNVLLEANRTSDTREYTFNSSFTSSGTVNVTCIADNKAFSVSVSKYLTLKGAPEIPKILKFSRQDKVSPTEIAQEAIIMCQSAGGFPYSKNLSLICENIETTVTNIDTVMLYLNMTYNQTDVHCTCIVLHESKCLPNKTAETIRLSSVDPIDDSSPAEINTAAIAVGVTLGSGLIILASVIIVILRRNRRNNRDILTLAKSKTKNGKDYNTIPAPYVNIEVQTYETANINSTYLNENMPAPAPHYVNETINDSEQDEKEEKLYYDVADIQ